MTMTAEDVTRTKLMGVIWRKMLRAIGPEVILKSAKGLKKFGKGRKGAKESLYGVDKGCVTHLMVLCFLLELLILKIKYGWSDCNFSDLFASLVMFAPVAKLSSRQHI